MTEGLLITLKLYAIVCIGDVKQSLSQLPLLEMPPLCKGRWLGSAVTVGLLFTLKLYAIACISAVKQSLSQLR